MFGGQFRAFRSLLATGRTSAPRHAKRSIASAISVAVVTSGLLLVPVSSANAVACAPSTTTENISGVEYTLVAIKSVGPCDWAVPTGVTELTHALVVAGGGGGGAHVGAGGGAGGLLQLTNQSISGTLTITVGDGGVGARTAQGSDVDDFANGGREAANGGNSTLTIGGVTSTAVGGGHGAFWWNGGGENGVAGIGGSGGGGVKGTGTSYSGGAATSGQGNAGGSADNSKLAQDNGYLTGGGGGAGLAGGNAVHVGAPSYGSSGNGGAGLAVTWLSDTVATSLSIGDTAPSGTSPYFAGGGGGGFHSYGPSAGAGGAGGGGAGAGPTSAAAQTVQGFSGLTATGGGGGGSGAPSTSTYISEGGKGGSGVVVLRYVTPVVPSQVQGFSAATRYVDAGTDSDSVTLNWTALTGQTPAVTGYSIQHSVNSDFSSPSAAIAVSGGSTTSTTITGLDDGKTYYFRIYAVNDVGNSATAAETVSRAVSKDDYALDFDNPDTTYTGDATLDTSQGVIPENGNFTVEAWIKPDAPETVARSADTYYTIVSQNQIGGGADSGRFYLGLRDDAGTYKLHYAASTSSTNLGGDIIAIPDSRWSHIAVTGNGSGGKVYLNGTLVYSDSSVRNGVRSNNFGFLIGGTGFDVDEARAHFFNGQIDQVKIWDDALIQTEIEDSMHAWQADTNYDGTDDIEPSLISHYDFNDSTQASTIRDMAGANDLTLTNGSTDDYASLVNRPTKTGYEVYEFTRSYLTATGGWTMPDGVSGGEYLVVAGGGGGASGNASNHGGGGGGAGGFRSGTLSGLSGALPVIVGAGGSAGVDRGIGGQGQDSTLSTITSGGGGGGGSYGAAATDGGSGGGAGASATHYNDPGSGISGQGNDGGVVNKSATYGRHGAGGGGADAVGGSTTTNSSDGTITGSAGAGGSGKLWSITGERYAGGGGGGGNTADPGSTGGGAGGAGGGGTGATWDGSSTVQATAGTANTGGGGGGGSGTGGSTESDGAAGGSGIAIFAYALTNTVTFNPNGGTGSATTQSIVSDQATALTANSFNRTGYTFAGWNTDADGTSGTDYTDQQSVTITGPLNLYAKWTATSDSLRLYYNSTDLNSFDPTGSSVTDLSGNSVSGTLTGTLPLDATDRDWTFGGSSYIDVGDLDSTNFANGLTVDFEADFGSTAENWERIIDFGTGQQQDNLLITREGTSSNLALELYIAGVSAGKCTYLDVIGSASGLQRWTISIDGTNCKIYLDAESTPGYSAAYTALPTTGITWGSNFIGKSNWSADALFKGSIRYLRIYEGALTPAQIGAVSYKTVSFDSNGATDPASMVTSGAIALPTVTKTGYTFNGWYSDAGLTTSVGAAGASYTPSADITLYAKWTANTYTITYNTNSSTGGTAPADQTKTHDTDLTLASNSGSLVRTGYTFAGWNTQADGLGTSYAAGASYSVEAGDELFAKWTPLTNRYAEITSSSPGSGAATGKAFKYTGQALPADRTSWSIEAWFYEKSHSGNQNPILSQGIDGGAGFAVMVLNRDSNRELVINDGGWIYTSVALPQGQWHHFAYTFDNGSYVVYVNGKLAASGTASGGTNSGNFLVGENAYYQSGSPRHVFYGYVDQVKIWSDPLTEANVQTSMHSRGDGGISNLEHHYSFDNSSNPGEDEVGSKDLSANGTGTNIAYSAFALDVATPTTGLSGMVGTAFALPSFSPGGNGQKVFTVSSGTLPAGLSINSASGLISGTPTSAGSQTVQVTVTDSTTSATTSSFTIAIAANTYTITFNKGTASGATGADQTASKTNGVDLALPDSATANTYFTRTGYTVTSWSTNADGSTSDYALGASYTTDAADTLYPVWTANTYTVTYNYNGATGNNSTTSSDYNTGGTAITLPTPTKTGYTFGGWYTNSDLNDLSTIGAGGASYTPTTSLTVYAKWTGNSNTVTFKSNFVGGASDSTQSITSGQATALTANAFTRGGYTFAGWNTNADGTSGTDYTNQESVTITGALTLYAKWTLQSVPSGPTAVTSTVSGSSLVVSWSAPVELASKTITGYKVEYANADRDTWSTAGVEPWQVASSAIAADATSYTITGLTPGQSYYVRVAALYSGGQGAYGYRWTTAPVYETTQAFRDSGGKIVYSTGKGVDSSGNAETSVTDFSRVRYRMEATYGGSANYVDANFDRELGTKVSGSSNFDSIDKLQVPTTSGTGAQFRIQGNISDLNIQSNVTGVIDGAGLNGRLELWPHNYETTSAFGDGSGDDYDISDTSLGTGDYGSFQLHRLDGVNEPVLSWNRHKESNINNVDIGFGAQSTGNPDWTFAARDEGATGRTNFKLQIFVNEPVEIPSNYTLSFDANGGTGTMSAQTLAAATATTINNNSFARAGYFFDGWNTQADGGGTSYANAGSITISANTTLYAKWDRATYTFSFDNNYSGDTDSTITYYSGDTVTLPTPTRDGYTFKGWYTATTGGTKLGDAGDTYSPLVSNNLILRYELDDPSSYSGSGTTITDISADIASVAGAVNATATNGPAFSTADGMSFSFDGTNDYILTGDLKSRFGADNRAVSLFAWVYPTGNGVIVSELGQTTINSNWHDSQIEMVSGKLRFSTWGGSHSTTNVIESGTITLNQWYYVGLTHTGTTLSAYIDGQAIGTKSYTRNAPTVTANATAGVHYGLGATDSTNLGDGTYGNFKLGSFHVYKSGISAADVLANYQATCARFDDSCTERTVYAQWQQAGYDITFSAGDNSTGSDVSATKTFDVAYTIPNADTSRGYFTRTGYTLTAWAANSDGTGTSYDFGDSYATNEALTLYPVWTANTYTITFNKGSVTGASGADQTATKTHDQNLALPNSATANGYFTKTGYTVTGWSTSQDGSTSDFALGANYTTEEADTLYPVWTADTYTVTYSYDGATSGNSTASSDYTVDSIVVSLPTPLKTGYTFAGWYSEAGLTNLVGLAGASYSPSADITLYAKWSAATFTVIFDYNEATGGNGTASDTFTTGGTAITLPTPTRTGYTFGGWYSNSNLTDLSTVGAGGANYSPTSNLTIYAKWTGITRNVNYNDTNSTGGSVPTDSADYIIGDSVVVKANSGLLARTGYTFAGWVTNSDGSGTAKNAGETITVATADIELYPKWTANTYTITYNRNGATGGSLAKATDTYTTGALSGTPLAGGGTMTKTGYSFNGWSTTTTGTIPLGAFTTTADVTVYAIWSPVDSDFDYDLNTGSGTAPTTQSANITETVTISGIGSATKTGHWFGGWNTATDGSGSTYAAGATASIPVDGATLYAIWVPDQYRISYNANGGTGGPDLSATDGFDTATFGVAYTLRAINDLARTGYTFSHWSLNAAGTGDKYDLAQNSLDELTQYTPTANTTFYAQWTAVSYSHTFDVAGGSASLGTYGRTLGQSLSMPSAGTRTGYVFDSWTDGTNDYAIGSTYTVTAANKSFTAQWIPNVYTVTYDWSGGASDTPDTSDSFTVGTGPMDLPTATGSGYSRDGYTFSGWSTTPGGTLVSDFEPTADDVLYAVWADGNYTLTYVPKGGTVGSGLGTVGRGSAVTLPTPVRANFRFTGWYDSASGGVKIGNGGDSFTPGNSRSLHARWVQNSLFGVDEATLESGSTYTASDSTGTDSTLSHTPSGTSARVQIPAGALDAGTVVSVRYFKETDRQSELIDSDNSYFFALLVSWLKGSGDTATVPTTASGKPITVTLNNDSIVAGAMVYQVIGDTVTELGRATENGTVTVELTEDPEIVVAATAPSAPTSVAGVAGDTAATVSWTAGSSGGAAITSYTVTASPGGATCTTATTSCVVTGLTNNTSYTFSVTATNSIGTSTASSSSSAVTPVGASYVVTFNSNGGSSVSAGSFFSGGSVTAPTDPTRSGYTFAGWSTVLDDDTTEVSFPYSPGVLTAITLYALWTENPVVPSSGGSVPTPPDTVTPTPPATPVTKPIGSVEGSNQKVTVVADAPKEKLVASGAGWELEIAAKTTAGAAAPVKENLNLEFQLGSKAAVSGSGLRPKTKVTVWVFSDPTFVGEVETNDIGGFDSNLDLPASILPGNHTLQVLSTDALGRTITLNIPITVKGKVTVGTFKGYLALYTKDLVGQKLSAKVAGKWLVQNPIANYKSYGYSRVVRKTGAGYKIYVHLYLNGSFLRTDVITTR